ncbi:hypothetical protein MMC08_008113 [Hypocenomyce scalaris]|nr:hypothetical protein [Hypocenomyce scalaris]
MVANRLIGAIAVTVPSCAYLLQPNPDKGHGHDDPEHEGRGHQGHVEHEETSEGGDDSEQGGDAKDETQSGDDTSKSDKEEGKSDDSDSEGGEQQDTPETSDDEEPKKEIQEKDGGGDVEGVRGKGATKEGKPGNTRKSFPDAKGGNKKRIESDYGKKQGHDPEGETREEDGNIRDKPAPSKPEGSQNSTSGKQAGLSNTDTKHSTDIAGDEEKSTKSDGSPATAKAKGSIDPNDPKVEE